MMRVLFSLLLKLKSYHPHTFTSPLQQTLKQNYRASHNCCSVKNMLKLLAFKWLLNELLLETEWSEAMLIRSFFIFFKVLLFIVLMQAISHLQLSLWKYCFVFILFFPQKSIIFLFATIFKKRLWHRCFPVSFVKLLRIPFFTEHLWWLLPHSLKWNCKTKL